MHTIEFIGVRGGHGTTTVALAAAATLATRGPTRIAAHDPDALCVTAGTAIDRLPSPLAERLDLTLDSADVHVLDAGTLERYLDLGPFDHQPPPAVQGGGERSRIAVLRGPDYVGLRTLCDHHDVAFDGIVVVAEAGRALDARDVEHVTSRPVVAVVEHTPTVARAIDAGLLLRRCHALREFSQFRTWITHNATQEAPCATHA